MTSTLRDVTPFLAAVGLFQPTNLRSCRCPNGSRAHRSGRTRATVADHSEVREADHGIESRGPGAARMDSLSRFQQNATVACLIEACGRSTRLRSPWLAPT